MRIKNIPQHARLHSAGGSDEACTMRGMRYNRKTPRHWASRPYQGDVAILNEVVDDLALRIKGKVDHAPQLTVRGLPTPGLADAVDSQSCTVRHEYEH